MTSTAQPFQPKAKPAHAEQQRQHLSPQQKHERKQRVLTKGTPSVVQSIADAIVAKDGDVFFLADQRGQVPLGGSHGFGLYYHDCRYLSGYELKLAGSQLHGLVATGIRNYEATYELTNPDIRLENDRLVAKDTIGIKWTRIIDSEFTALRDVLTIQNYGLEPVTLPLSLCFEATFDDLFAVRGLLDEHPGKLHAPAWQDGVLCFRYDGADGRRRSLNVRLTPAPAQRADSAAQWSIALAPRESKQVLIGLEIDESDGPDDIRPAAATDLRQALSRVQTRLSGYRSATGAAIESNSVLINQVVERARRDLRMLETQIGEDQFFAAGVPWFVTLFGRDSLITSYQALAFNPAIAEQTLRLLAKYQGDEVSDWQDEQPGKVLHEMRIGELARMGAVPYTPYYGTIDATPLFLIVLAEHARWTGRLDLFHELKDNAERALNWIDRFGDTDGDGYVDYRSTSENGLINQGWKDSGDAIVNRDGSLARPPIALVEVQGYVYAAKRGLADLFERSGDAPRAEALRHQADELQDRFNRDFWLPKQQFYALALQAGGKPAAVISSNPGQALWTGIVAADRASQVIDRLLEDDMFNGWGVRTLSSKETLYNPIGYHLGTVWPHDNSLIAAGCRRYGRDDAARQVVHGILDAALHFPHFRLPEVFAGFTRPDYGVPVHYPVACHPQAWAAGTILYFVQTMLGLEPAAFDHRLRIRRPMLPHFNDQLELRDLAVGDARVDLRFTQTDGSARAEVLRVDGDLDVQIDLVNPPERAPRDGGRSPSTKRSA